MSKENPIRYSGKPHAVKSSDREPNLMPSMGFEPGSRRWKAWQDTKLNQPGPFMGNEWYDSTLKTKPEMKTTWLTFHSWISYISSLTKRSATFGNISPACNSSTPPWWCDGPLTDTCSSVYSIIPLALDMRHGGTRYPPPFSQPHHTLHCIHCVRGISGIL